MTCFSTGLRAPRWRAWMVLALTLALHAGAAWAAQHAVKAFLDRSHAELGDTVTLNVQVDDAGNIAAPDLDGLSADFDVLDTSRNTSIQIVNGQQSRKTLWAVALRPRHIGTLTIPPLKVAGGTTQPLTLTVAPAPAHAEGGPGDDVFIETTVDTDTPYVGQEVNLTVRLFYAPNLTDGNLDQPAGDDVDVQSLGRGTRYGAERGGRRYHVLEQHYALFPRHAGDITLAPLHFHGSALDDDGFPAMFNGGRPVQARSSAQQIHVRARPSTASAGDWLPARQLDLELQGLPKDGRIQVGEPLTLTLSEDAQGLSADTLPSLQLPRLQGAEVYPDKQMQHTGNDGQWLHGLRMRKFAIVPQQAGTLTIPAITLHWWNVVSDREETATLPARTLTVTPAPGVAAAPPAPAGSTAETASAGQAAALPAGGGSTGGSWRTLALASLALWVLTLLAVAAGWWRAHRNPGPPAPAKDEGARRLRNAFLHAARSGDVTAQAEALLAWARLTHPQLRNLGEVADRLLPGPQREAIAALQAARYAADATGAPSGESLAAAFAGGLRWAGEEPDPRRDDLPPLYPR